MPPVFSVRNPVTFDVVHLEKTAVSLSAVLALAPKQHNYAQSESFLSQTLLGNTAFFLLIGCPLAGLFTLLMVLPFLLGGEFVVVAF